MEFNAIGNVSQGIHDILFSDFIDKFVYAFHDSDTRLRNINGMISFFSIPFFEEYRELITFLWIDGSFCTNKVNPNDIDGVILINPFLNFNKAVEMMTVFNNSIKGQGHSFYSDFYITFDFNEFPEPSNPNDIDYSNFYSFADQQYNYWRSKFSFDRNENPKGLFRIQTEGGDFSEFRI